MDYKKVNSILPEELLKAVQEYADGMYLYIPRKQSNKRKWGELKNTRNHFAKRNEEIYKTYLKGVSVLILSDKYNLSDKAIYKIIKQQKH